LVNKTNTNSYKFPKIIFQTYHSISKIPKYIYDNKKEFASGYKVEIYDDTTGLEFLKKYFTQPVIDKFKELTGAHKADLLRYCLLYIYGGVYLDIKTILTKNLDSFLNFDNLTSHRLYTVKASTLFYQAIYQGFIATTANNPIFINLINLIIHTPKPVTKIVYHIFTIQMYDLIKSDFINNILFTEKCIIGNDRYGLYCVVNKNNDKLFNVRDPKYPY
jgi:hypothetical protein